MVMKGNSAVRKRATDLRRSCLHTRIQTMKFYRCLVAALLALVLFAQFIPKTHACGPEILMPIFVFKESPDIPCAAFAGGKIGIVQPAFGRKTLVISYRYLNGGSFTPDEQHELVE